TERWPASTQCLAPIIVSGCSRKASWLWRKQALKPIDVRGWHMPENEKDSGTALLQAVQRQVKQIQTSSLDLSFNELLDMYTNKELIIDPAYQRAFRWSEGKE